MLACLPFLKSSRRLLHLQPDCSTAWRTLDPFKSWTETHHRTCTYHPPTSFPNCYSIACMLLVNNTSGLQYS